MFQKRTESSNQCVPFFPESHCSSKRNFLKIAALAILAMAPFLNTCGLFNSGDSNRGEVKKADDPAKNRSIPTGARPPIDLSVPAKVETATFAMG